MLAEKTIRKHVSIIHAYSLMSILQRKIVNVLLYEAIKSDNRINQTSSVAIECHIPFSRLCKAIKFNSNNTQYLKEAVDGLASLKIEWNLLKDKAPTDISFLNLRVLHGSPTFYQDNTLNFSFHKVMLNLVDNPSIYGTLDVDVQSEFESKYGHALYENSTRFVNLQKNKVIQLDIFRKLLGVPEDKYTSMREFTRNIITPSIEEVNDRANFVVNLSAIKSGKKITGFEVSVKNKEKLLTNHFSCNSDNEEIFKLIKQTFGTIKDAVLENIIKNYSKEYILQKISYTKEHAKKDNFNLYPVPYFISALKHDYKSNEELQKIDLQPIKIKNNDEWKITLNKLIADLAHWEKISSYPINKSHKAVVNTTIIQCKEKIKQHYLNQPMLDEVVT